MSLATDANVRRQHTDRPLTLGSVQEQATRPTPTTPPLGRGAAAQPLRAASRRTQDGRAATRSGAGRSLRVRSCTDVSTCFPVKQTSWTLGAGSQLEAGLRRAIEAAQHQGARAFGLRAGGIRIVCSLERSEERSRSAAPAMVRGETASDEVAREDETHRAANARARLFAMRLWKETLERGSGYGGSGRDPSAIDSAASATRRIRSRSWSLAWSGKQSLAGAPAEGGT
jgi:hypothetical protein